MSVSTYAETLYVSSENEYALTPYAETYGDVSKKMELDEVQNVTWSSVDTDTLTFPSSKMAFWMKYRLENNTTMSKSYYLTYDINHINYLDVYIMQNKTVLQSFQTGAYRPASQRPEIYHKYLFPITLQPSEHKIVYVRMQHFAGNTAARMTLVDKEVLREQDYVENILQSFFFGIIAVMLLYNILLYLMTGYKPYIPYILYLGSFGFWLSFRLGYGFILFEYENVALYKYLQLTSSGLFNVFIIWFIVSVLDLKNTMPKAELLLKVIASSFIFIWLSLLLSMYFESYSIMQILLNIYLVSFIVMVFSILFITLKLALKGDQTAQLLFPSWLLLLVTLLVMILSLISILPHYTWITLAMLATMSLEAVLFSLILGNRYRQQNKRYLEQTRLADMGSMIENIAHQWRQPLSGVNADLLAMRIYLKKNESENIEKQILKVEEKTKMMSSIVHDFSKFYAPHKVKETFLLKTLIEKACMYNKEAFAMLHLDCELKLDPSLKIYGVENEYFQVLLAILNNAREALLETEQTEKNIIVILKKEDAFAVLSIYNNGPKILKKHCSKLFSPYFTTKENKMGSGIGLYMSRKIITEGFEGTIDMNNDKEGVIMTIKVKHV